MLSIFSTNNTNVLMTKLGLNPTTELKIQKLTYFINSSFFATVIGNGIKIFVSLSMVELSSGG